MHRLNIPVVNGRVDLWSIIIAFQRVLKPKANQMPDITYLVRCAVQTFSQKNAIGRSLSVKGFDLCYRCVDGQLCNRLLTL